MSLKLLGVLKSELGKTSGTTAGESTGTSEDITGEGVTSGEGIDKMGSEGKSTGLVEIGSSTGAEESANGKVESAELVENGSCDAGIESSFAGASADRSAGILETDSGAGDGLSIGRTEMVESGSMVGVEIGSIEGGDESSGFSETGSGDGGEGGLFVEEVSSGRAELVEIGSIPKLAAPLLPPHWVIGCYRRREHDKKN